MRPLSAVGAILVGAALAIATVSPASAAFVRPSRAPLTNTSGATNGCVAEVPPLSVVRPAGSSPLVTIPLQLTCDASADVHWDSFSTSLFEVLPDGSLRNEWGPTLGTRGTSGAAVTGPILVTTTVSCLTPAFQGTHTWLFRGSVKTKHFNHDPDQYVAKVARLQTVTCP